MTSVSPADGPVGGGTSVIVKGTGFATATAVDFGTTAVTTYTVNSSTQITATDAAGTGTVDVTVVIPGGGASATSAADQFTYASVTVTAVHPSVGPTAGGTSIVITGSGFVAGSTAVEIGSTSAMTFTVNSATQITATDSAGSRRRG